MSSYELNLRDYWLIIQKRRWQAVSIFFAVFITVIIYTKLQKPAFQASSMVQYVERKTVGDLLSELVNTKSEDTLMTQAKIITSLSVIEKVVVDIGEINKQDRQEEITNKARALRGGISTEILPGTNIIRIIAVHGMPKTAADIANKTAEVYVEENLNQKRKEARLIREFIEKQVEQRFLAVKEAEEKLVKFKEILVPSGVGLPLQDKLAALESEQQNLLRQYTLLHPDVKNVTEQIKQLKGQLKNLPRKELEFNRLSRRLEVFVRSYRELRSKLDSARITEVEKNGDVTIIERAFVPYSPVSPNKPLNYLLGALLGILLGLTAAFMVEHVDASIGTIEDVEEYLKLPVLGVIPFLRIKTERKKKTAQTEKALQLRDKLLLNYSGSSPVFEAYRILRTSIQSEMSKENRKEKILLITSSAPQEGKSVNVSNLAVVMAQAGLRTLLIDADMRRSTIHYMFGIKNKEPGLSDCLRGTVKYKDAIRTFTDILMGQIEANEILKTPYLDNLYILTSGSSMANPAESLANGQMAGLLDTLKDNFDIILIDSPPLLAVADTTIFASVAGGVILVYQVGRTNRNVLKRATIQLAKCGAQVKGIILNNISPAVEMSYRPYYNYKYYGKYYGKEKTAV